MKKILTILLAYLKCPASPVWDKGAYPITTGCGWVVIECAPIAILSLAVEIFFETYPTELPVWIAVLVCLTGVFILVGNAIVKTIINTQISDIKIINFIKLNFIQI